MSVSYPAYAPDKLLPAVRDYLIDLGLVRNPNVAGNEPPFWLDPKRGVPYPGQTEGLGATQTHPDLVLAAYPATGIPSAPLEGFYVRLGVVIFYRGRTSPIVQSMHEQIRSALHDRRNLNMNGLLVNESMMTREIQRIGSSDEGYVYNTEFLMDLWNDNYVYS